jgi:hypothetical protein
VTRVALKYEFEASRMKSDMSHPDEWLAELEKIRQQLALMNKPISDDDLMLHVLVHLPKLYESIAEQLEKRVEHATNPLTLDELREELCAKYQQIKRQNGQEESTALATRKSGFCKGTCRICGKYGHRGSDCWNKNGNQATTTTITQGNPNNSDSKNNKSCKYCKKVGHSVEECWKLKNKKEQDEQNKNSNDEKQNKNENTKKEKTDDKDMVLIATQFDSDIALQCMSIKIEKNLELWIRDTGATAHKSNSPDGFENIK